MAISKRRIIFIIFIVFCVVAGIIGLSYYNKIFAPNVKLTPGNEFIFIKTGSSFADVADELGKNKILVNNESFSWLAGKMNYSDHVLAGKYKLINGMNNRELVTLLRSGKQTPVKVTFNNIRTKYELAGRIASQIEADSISIVQLLTDSIYAKQNDFSKDNIAVMFIPNTYEFYWNTSAEKFLRRMKSEYEKFWNENRKSKAKAIGFSPIQVSILASVVEQETKKNDEKPILAGIYINRLNKGWRLEADPTLVFALGNFSIRRVLNEHKKIESPYNTYKHDGLPPGPICIPEISSLTAVLNYSKHEYMYFCARSDLSGYHAYARTYAQHLINAHKYQKELNKRNIKE